MQNLSPEITDNLEDDAFFDEDDLPFEDQDVPEENLEFEEIPFDDNLDLGDFASISLVNDHKGNRRNQRVRILDFGNSRQDKNVTLLWPVYLWRVAAPIPITSQVNFLVLVCIRLADAGVRTISDQAQYLALSKDLVGNILNEARHAKYLDEKYRITPKGEDLLESEGIEHKTNTQYGWILQESVSGDVLPFFYSDGLDKLTIPVQNKITLSIPVLFPDQHKPHKPPEASLISQRLKTYYKLKKEHSSETQNLTQCSSEDTRKNIETDSVGFSIEKEDLPINETTHQVVRVLSKRPDLYDLAVRVRIDGTADGSFSILCPFGLPDAMRWMRLFYFGANQNKQIQKILDNLKSQSLEVWKQNQPTDLDPIELSRQAYSRLVYEIGKPLSSPYQSTWTELEKMMQSKIRLERGFDEADSTITRCQKALEQLMLTLIKAEPVSEEVTSLYEAKGELARCIRDTVTACGATSIPNWLTRPRIQEVRDIIMRPPSKSLRDYVSTFVFVASRKGKSWQILQAVLKKNSDFLDEMSRVAKIRNKHGAHANGNHFTGDDYISTQADELVKIVCKNVCLLTNS
ncbi:hypothetical protein [Prochlorothrix hollandica]|uniref:Uncharacterized protein n=1 Tax=Prochlorothrix hollandica PCC 9006 = CALU 1027 TaxID=317619 RepID=A0A0M2PZI3_PROHO|nr:hypothetical protein [Prochlorothrix hollandica]KKJ01570.1 hypothetical protein PROH_04560 [Prochlorothrix hollandica PCC 9006 = CALU 1027]